MAPRSTRTRTSVLALAGWGILLPFGAIAQSSDWDATLFLDPFPSPYLSDWEMNPTMARLTVTNGTGQDVEVVVRLSVTDGSGREVIRSRSDPVFIPAGVPTSFDTGSSLSGRSAYDADIEDVIYRTGRFPEGDYLICATVTDRGGFMLVDNVCEFFSTFFPDPPYLFFPMDGDTVNVADPILEWSPVQTPVTMDTRYLVQVAEIGPSQTPHTALTSGILHFEGVSPFNPSLSYPMDALPFTHGRRYAWWVQALDPNGLPLTSNQGRSEIWTFTYLDDGGGGGEEGSGNLQGTIVPRGTAGSSPLANLGTASFADVRSTLNDPPENPIHIPLPIGTVGSFEALHLSNARAEFDVDNRAMAITATAHLPMGAVDVLLMGFWDEEGTPRFAFAVEPLIFQLGEWIEGVEESALGEWDWSGGTLTITDHERVLDGAMLPPSVERFYGAPIVDLGVGITLFHTVPLGNTELGARMRQAGLEAGTAEIRGLLGFEPAALFGAPSEMDAPDMELRATLRGAGLSSPPDWLRMGDYVLRVTNDPELAVRAEVAVEADLSPERFPFVLAADLTRDEGEPLVFTGRMTEAWDAPFGIDWLTLDGVLLTVTPRDGEVGPADAVLEGELAMGEQRVGLRAVLQDGPEGLEARFTASVDELSLDDLVAFAEGHFGASPFGDQLPSGLGALRNVAVEARSGEPPTLTVLGEVEVLGQSTEFLYTFVPPDLTGGEALGGIIAVRLPDFSLGELISPLQGSPFGDFRFPSLSLARGPPGEPPVEEEVLEGPPEASGGWSIGWPNLSGLARGFFSPTHPCAEDGPSCEAAEPDPDDPGRSDPRSLNLRPGLNFSAPFSLSQLSTGVRGLLSFGTGGGEVDPEEPADEVVLEGSPGFSFGDLLSGTPDLSAVLNLRATLPPLPDGTVGLPDWITPRSRSIRIVQDPEVRLTARAVIDADLDGPRRFDLAADLTNAEGGGAAFEGLMEGSWNEPFGLTWLALDSVHMAVGAGSVGARVALGSKLEIGTVTAALFMDVRGPSGDRSVDFDARAGNLSTTDVVTFLNQAFDAGLPTPTSSVTLDSLQVGFSTGDAEAFRLVGSFSSDLDGHEVLLAVGEMVPGYTAPSELPFELGALGNAWFELQVVPDSVWGGFGGRVALEAGGTSGLEGEVAVRIGSRRGTDEGWLALELDAVGRDLDSEALLDGLATLVGEAWELPEGLDALGQVALDSVRARVELDSRDHTAGAFLAGAGRFSGEGGGLDATVDLGFFVESDEIWSSGALTLALRGVPVTSVISEAEAVLPGDWALPSDLDAMAPVRLDSATLALGFDSRADSLSAEMAGAGSMGEGQELAAAASLTLARVPDGDWAAGRLDVALGAMSLPEALDQAEELLGGGWQLPDALSGMAPLGLESGTLGVGFDSRTSTFMTQVTGAAWLGEGPGRMEGTLDLSLVASDGEQFARGGVTLGVRELALTGVLDQVASLLPGSWSLPEGFSAFDGLHLDEADLALGFDTRTDSLSARTRGSGRLDRNGSGLTADADITFLQREDGSGARGTLALGRDAVTMSEALDQIADMLPGTWQLPDGVEAFDRASLDRADFVLGFDTRADSIFAAVSGAGSFDGLGAEARLDFLRRAEDDRVTGLLTLAMGSVTASQALDRIGELLPGEWALPQGFGSFDALTLDAASLQAGFDTGADSLWAGFQGDGRLDDVSARARLGFSRIQGSTGGDGLVTLDLGDISLGDAFNRAGGMLPGSWPVPQVDFPIGDLRNVALEMGFDTRADSIWAGVEADARLAERDGRAALKALSLGNGPGDRRSWAEGSFRLDVGTVTLRDALVLAADLAPGSPQVPDLDFDVGRLQDVVLEAGFRTGDDAASWAGLEGVFRLGGRTARAEAGLSLGSGPPDGHFRASFDEPFGVSDVVELMAGFLPDGNLELPPLGQFDVRLDQPWLALRYGERSGVSFGGESELFGKPSTSLFSFAHMDGRPQLTLGFQVPDLDFGDLVPGFDNPITEQLRLSLAALTITRGSGEVSSEDMTPEERDFYRPMAGGGSSGNGQFNMDFLPGLNLTGLMPLDGSGALKDMVDMISPGASDLTLRGNLPLPGFGGGGIRDLSLRAALPPMAPPGSPAWFVEGEVALQITGRPSVGLAGALTVDVEGDTLTFDIESNVAVVPAGVELSIAGGLAAARPWVGPLGVEWLTLNEIRLALGLNPVSVRLGFLGDAVIGSQDIRLALGTRLNIYTGVPMGVLALGETEAGLTLSDLLEFHQQVAGDGVARIPGDRLPDMALRDLGVRVATYTDFDLGVEAGIGLRGAFLIETTRNGSLTEFGRMELSVDRNGVIGSAQISDFSLGPVAFDEALLDLALTLESQHLVIQGGATIENTLSADIDLSMDRDSLRFSTEFDLFDQFRAQLRARAGFQLTNPTFMVTAILEPEFNDEVTYGLAQLLVPYARGALQGASDGLDAAEEALTTAEATLDDAIEVASEASRVAMDAARVVYDRANRNYRTANSRYHYHRSRCSGRRPGHCSARNYWRGVRSARLGQRSVRLSAYRAARAVYENREYLEDSAPVRQARAGMNEARAAFNQARTEVDRLQEAMTTLQAWMDSYESCPTCARPSIPVQVTRAEAEAALAGFFGRSSVDLTVRYRFFGSSRTLQAGFGGSVADLSQSIFTAVSDALF